MHFLQRERERELSLHEGYVASTSTTVLAPVLHMLAAARTEAMLRCRAPRTKQLGDVGRQTKRQGWHLCWYQGAFQPEKNLTKTRLRFTLEAGTAGLRIFGAETEPQHVTTSANVTNLKSLDSDQRVSAPFQDTLHPSWSNGSNFRLSAVISPKNCQRIQEKENKRENKMNKREREWKRESEKEREITNRENPRDIQLWWCESLVSQTFSGGSSFPLLNSPETSTNTNYKAADDEKCNKTCSFAFRHVKTCVAWNLRLWPKQNISSNHAANREFIAGFRCGQVEPEDRGDRGSRSQHHKHNDCPTRWTPKKRMRFACQHDSAKCKRTYQFK